MDVLLGFESGGEEGDRGNSVSTKGEVSLSFAARRSVTCTLTIHLLRPEYFGSIGATLPRTPKFF